MKDIAQTVAVEAYAGQPKAIVAGLLIFLVTLFLIYFKEVVKKEK